MAFSSAFLKLVELAERCRQHSAGLPSRDESVAHWSGVGFTMNSVRYVVAIDGVSEVMPVPQCTKVPGVSSWVRGVANVRGRLIPIMDLLVFLGQSPELLHDHERRVLLVEQDELSCGLVVDEVLGMQHFPVTEFSDDAMVRQEVSGFALGAYRREQEEWVVFSLAALMASQGFLQVAKTA